LRRGKRKFFRPGSEVGLFVVQNQGFLRAHGDRRMAAFGNVLAAEWQRNGSKMAAAGQRPGSRWLRGGQLLAAEWQRIGNIWQPG
jgi:hypothetical protein